MPAGWKHGLGPFSKYTYEDYNCIVCDAEWHAVMNSMSYESKLCGNCWADHYRVSTYVNTIVAVSEYLDTLKPTEPKEEP